jgi:exopolyphosphatase / guanosine-5'-triphosphate,3'-diphosphate pyrophosphatase
LGGAGNSPHYAAIDVGSHTTRLLIARLEEERRLVPVRSERRVTRLARQFQTNQNLNETAIQASLEVLGEYAAIIGAYRVVSIECGATGVVRNAPNGMELMERLRYRTGISGSILSESSEALLSAKGVISVLPERVGRFLTFDLGGSTTEFLLAERLRDEPLWSTSVPVGASTITERYLAENPPGEGALEQARCAIHDILRETLDRFSPEGAPMGEGGVGWDLVGTAGTVTTLAAMKLEMDPYVPFRVNGVVLDEEWLHEIIRKLSTTKVSERRRIPGLEEGREDVILGGALIVHDILLGLRRTSLIVTDAGLLEGLLLHLVEKERFGCAGMRTVLTWSSGPASAH